MPLGGKAKGQGQENVPTGSEPAQYRHAIPAKGPVSTRPERQLVLPHRRGVPGMAILMTDRAMGSKGKLQLARSQ